MKNFKRAIACIFIFVGGIGLPTALLSLINPFGAKLYDVGDPLGSPVSFGEVSIAIIVYIILLVVGIWLAVSERRNAEPR
jgi:hypothetical protein